MCYLNLNLNHPSMFLYIPLKRWVGYLSIFQILVEYFITYQTSWKALIVSKKIVLKFLSIIQYSFHRRRCTLYARNVDLICFHIFHCGIVISQQLGSIISECGTVSKYRWYCPQTLIFFRCAIRSESPVMITRISEILFSFPHLGFPIWFSFRIPLSFLIFLNFPLNNIVLSHFTLVSLNMPNILYLKIFPWITCCLGIPLYLPWIDLAEENFELNRAKLFCKIMLTHKP